MTSRRWSSPRSSSNTSSLASFPKSSSTLRARTRNRSATTMTVRLLRFLSPVRTLTRPSLTGGDDFYEWCLTTSFASLSRVLTPLAPPQVPQPPPPHLNGNGVVPAAATAIPNGPLHGHVPSISPKVAPTVASNGVSVPPSIQKLADANEQTWLVIGSSLIAWRAVSHLSFQIRQRG